MSNLHSVGEGLPETKQQDPEVFWTEQAAKEAALAGIDHVVASRVALQGLTDVLRETFEQRHKAKLAAVVVDDTTAVVIRSGKTKVALHMPEVPANEINLGRGFKIRTPRMGGGQVGVGFDDKLSSPNSTYIEATKSPEEATAYTRNGLLAHVSENHGAREILEVTMPPDGFKTPSEDEHSQVSQFADSLIKAIISPYTIQQENRSR